MEEEILQQAESGMLWTVGAAMVAATAAFAGNKAFGRDKSNTMSLLWGSGAMTAVYLVGYSIIAGRAARSLAAGGLPPVVGTETGRLTVQLAR